MPPITISDPHSRATATILPEVGFNCFRFQADVGNQLIDIIDSLPEFASGTGKPSASGIPILFPFPNRIRQGRFTWQGRSFELPGTDAWGNAIHGFCLNRAWRVIDQGPDFVTGQFQLSVDAPDRLPLWPADFVLEVDYELHAGRLRSNFRISNPGTDDLPWGLGTHPYFRAPLLPGSSLTDCTVEVPAERRWVLENCLPTGEVVPVADQYDLRTGTSLAGLVLDDVLTGIDADSPQYDCTLIDGPAGLQVVQTTPPIFREVVLYTPPRGGLCIEPYTCTTDAINLEQRGVDAGLRTLSPGSEFHTWIDITAGLVLV